jgi:hypothetical protein
MEKVALYFVFALLGDFLFSDSAEKYSPEWASIVASVLISFGLEAVFFGE